MFISQRCLRLAQVYTVRVGFKKLKHHSGITSSLVLLFGHYHDYRLPSIGSPDTSHLATFSFSLQQEPTGQNMIHANLYTFPDCRSRLSFSAALLSLPPELQTRIYLFLSPDDLGVLSRCVDRLEGIDQDGFLRMVWFSQVSDLDPDPLDSNTRRG